jgi:kinetochore protein Spc25, fungi type
VTDPRRITFLSTEKERESALLDSHALQISQQLQACERTLHGVIEGIAKDQILVRFSHIDKSDLRREFSFVIDVSNRQYKGMFEFVIITKPKDLNVYC